MDSRVFRNDGGKEGAKEGRRKEGEPHYFQSSHTLEQMQ